MFGPPEIKEHDFDIFDRKYQGEYDPKRRPFLYDGPSNTVHIGPHGAYHRDLSIASGAPYRNAGYVMSDDGYEHNYNEVGAFGAMPPQVLDEVNAWAGINPSAPKKDSLRFGAAGSKINWIPGHKGKGLVFDDGTIWTWVVDPESLTPYHSEMVGKAMGEGKVPMKIYDKSSPTKNMPPEGWVRAMGAFHIDDNGRILLGNREVPEKFAMHILKEDPRLTNQGSDNPWSFGPTPEPQS